MSSKGNILLLEDEESLHEAIKLNLQLENYEVTGCYNGFDALDQIKQQYFDLLIIDLMLPEIDGLQVIETIRLTNTQTPILIISAKDSSAERITGLKKGADDYLPKPFELEELILRTQKLVSKSQQLQNKRSIEAVYSFGGNTINFTKQEAINFEGTEINLSRKEMMLLRLLCEYKGENVSREKILQTVWGYQVFPNTRTIDNFILNFRKYFEIDAKNPKHFFSVRSVGYRFEA
jgi:two-component system, OmpR family, alkaline phosphatase synthesis response regulator PhoP